MVWFYKRSHDELRIETRFDSASREYVVDITWPGRPMVTERFGDTAAFEARLLGLERQLEREHWQQAGGPEILPHGWRGPVTH